MPSVSRNQRVAMAIAEHHPDKLFARNKGMLKMSHGQLHDFAATDEEDLPKEAPSPLQKSMGRIIGARKAKKS